MWDQAKSWDAPIPVIAIDDVLGRASFGQPVRCGLKFYWLVSDLPDLDSEIRN